MEVFSTSLLITDRGYDQTVTRDRDVTEPTISGHYSLWTQLVKSISLYLVAEFNKTVQDGRPLSSIKSFFCIFIESLFTAFLTVPYSIGINQVPSITYIVRHIIRYEFAASFAILMNKQ